MDLSALSHSSHSFMLNGDPISQLMFFALHICWLKTVVFGLLVYLMNGDPISQLMVFGLHIC
jgi:hypothetical protein